MLLSRLVVDGDALLQRALDLLARDRDVSGGIAARGLREQRRGFEHREGPPRIAVSLLGEHRACLLREQKASTAESMVRVRERAREQRLYGVTPERFEHEHPHAAQQRTVDLEAGILGGGADQREESALHMREQGVLLAAIEPVDLVHEEHGACTELPSLLGFSDDLADARDPVGDGTERNELALYMAGDEPCDRRLAGARRTPEQDRPSLAALHGDAQRLPRRE